MPTFINNDSPSPRAKDPLPTGTSGLPGSSTPLSIGGVRAQRPFAPETIYSTSPWIPQIARGYIQRFDTASQQPYENPFHFCFNPNQIGVQYGTASDTISSANQDTSGNAGGIGGPSTISISFQLFVDRQFEVAYHGDTEGVTHDVGVLEDLLSVDAANPYMTQAAVNKFVLGTKLTFYAWVSSLYITYVYFNQDMIPMRCTIDISATLQSVAAPTKETLPLSSSTLVRGKTVSPPRR